MAENWFEKVLHTGADVLANVGIGFGKGLEGIVDLGAGIGGAVAGIFSDEAQDSVKDFIATDFTGKLYGDALQGGLDQSLLNNSKAGQIVEGVAQGVGQMLPAVIVSLATAGVGTAAGVAAGTATKAGQIAAMGTTIASAAGTGTEEAFQEGASYGQGLTYGAASGAVEGVTEKLTGGMGKLFGTGVMDDALKSVAKTGIKRVAKEAAGEAAEEALAEIANPALKSIYKGKDAWKEYASGEYWQSVGDAALIGGLTSAAYGGTLGRVMKTSGVYADTREVLDDVDALERKQRELFKNGKLTAESKRAIAETIKADYTELSKRLVKASEKTRADILQDSRLSDVFENDGTLKSDFVSTLDNRIVSAGDTTYDIRYHSPDLDSATIEQVLAKGSATAFSGDFDATQAANYTQSKEAFNVISEKSGGKVRFVVAKHVDGNAYYDPATGVIVMGADQFNGADATTDLIKGAIASELWQGSLVHETAHSTEGTVSHVLLVEHLMSNEAVYRDAENDFIRRGYFGKDLIAAQRKLNTLLQKAQDGTQLTTEEQKDLDTAQSEIAAIAAENVLGNEAFIKKLVKGEPGIAEKILNKIVQLKEGLGKQKGAQADKATAFLEKAERLYLKAIEESGYRYVKGKIVHTDDEEENGEKHPSQTIDGERQLQYNRGGTYVQWKSDALAWANKRNTKIGDRSFGSDGRYYYFYEATDPYNDGRATDYRVLAKVSITNKALINEWYMEGKRTNERNRDSVYESVDEYRLARGNDQSDRSTAMGQSESDGRTGRLDSEKSSSDRKGSAQKSHRPVSYHVNDDETITVIYSDGSTEVEKLRHVEALDNEGELRYSKHALYTSTAEFYRDVVYEDRHDFERSLANKTRGLVEGQQKTVVIYCGKNIYWFLADGYMHGVMLKSVDINDNDAYERARGDFENAINDDSEIIDLWSNLVSVGRTREESNLSHSRDRRGEGRTDYVSETKRTGDRAGDQRRGDADSSVDLSEVDSLIARLKLMMDAPMEDVGGTIQTLQDSETIIKKLREALEYQGNESRAQRSRKVQHSMASVRAETADKLKLQTAQQMLDDGIDSETIRQETGWYQGYDGKWRFEIDDSQMKFNRKGYYEADNPTLDVYVKHDALFAAYPDLRKVAVRFIDPDLGTYIPKLNMITLNPQGSDAENREVLVHEMQHIVQLIEDMAAGASPTYWETQLKGRFSDEYEYHNSSAYRCFKTLKAKASEQLLEELNEAMSIVKTKRTVDFLGEVPHELQSLVKKAQSEHLDKTLLDYYYHYLSVNETLERYGENNPQSLYRRTAGEIEASDAVDRLNLTTAQRKLLRPDIDRPDVVFSDIHSEFWKAPRYSHKPINDEETNYNSFGWVRENDVLTSGAWQDFTSKFAAAVSEQHSFPKTKGGEFMIAVNDPYDEGVNKYIVYAGGTIESPIISRVLEINLDNETELDIERRNIYAAERRGIQQTAGELRHLYLATDFRYRSNEQRKGVQKSRDYHQLGAERGRSGATSDRIKEFKVNGDGSYTTVYADGRSEVKFSRKPDGDTVTLSKGQLAALQANYQGDKVFTKKDVTAALKTVDAVQKLPAQMRNELINRLWSGYNRQLNAQGFERYTESIWHHIHAMVLQETDFEMTEDQIAQMDEQIVAALHQIVASGKPSVKAKLESDTSTEGYRAQAEYWRGEHDRAVQHNKLLARVKFEVEKLADLKKGRYINAANYRGDSFHVAITELAKMNWRGGLVRAQKIRERFATLAAWYTKENPLYKGANGANELFRQDIKEALDSLGNAQNGALTVDDLLAAETVIKYFAHEIEAHNTVYKNGKRVDAMPEARRYLENVTRAKEISVRCGIWQRLTRSAYAHLVADPAMLMRQADGYLDGFFTEQYEQLRQGTIDAAVLERELSEDFEKFWETHKAYGKRYNDATVTYEGKEMPLQEAISLYMTMKREQAFAGIAGAGFEIDGKDGKESISKGFADEVQKFVDAEYKKLPPEELLTMTKEGRARIERLALEKAVEARREALAKQFTAEDMELISLMEKTLEKCRDIKVKIDMIMQGYSNVTGGYYFPIRRTGLAENVDSFTGFEGDRVSNLSINKETVKNTHGLFIEPVHIVFMRHLKAISLYHGLGVFTDNFNRLYNLNINSPQIKETIQDNGPQRFFERYSENQKRNWATAKRIVICESDQQYREFIQNARTDHQNSKKIYFGIVSGEMADRIKTSTGIDVKGFNCSLSAYEIRKIFKDHGNEKSENLRGQRAMTEQDVFLIPEVMGSPDSIMKSDKTYNGKPVITFVKTSNGEKRTVSAVVSDDHLDLFVQTAFVGIKKGGLATPTGEQAPINTPKASSGTASSSSIPQNDDGVNFGEQKSYRQAPETIRDALGRSSKFAQEMIEYFRELKQDVEGISKKRGAERAYNDAVAYIRSAYATYQLGANPKVWVTQLSSLIAATNLLDVDCITKGLRVSGKDMDEYCRLAWLRNNDGAAVLAQSVTTGQNAVQRAASRGLHKVRDLLMAPISKVDRLVITRLFGACQMQIEKNGGAKLGTKENKVEAGKLLQRVILETQQNSLATERSAAMRSGDELLKGFTMFSADAMKVGARFVDGFGELSALRSMLKVEREKANPNDAEIKRLETQIKKAKGKCVRSTVALVGTALFNAMIAYGFKWLYRRDDEENAGTVLADTFGNMLGGLPLVRDIVGFFQDGFEMDHFLMSTINDVLGTAAASFELVEDAVSGKEVTKQQALANMRKILYAAGQLSGVPIRNIYNVSTGLLNRVSPETGYAVESKFYRQAYAADLQKALEVGDEHMAGTIAGLMIEEKINIENDAMRSVLQKLAERGYSVLPRSIGDTVTVEGENVTLSGKQQKRFRTVYGIGEEAVGDMVRLKQFNSADESVQAKAIQFIYDVYWDLALEDVTGKDLAEKNVLFVEAISIEKLAIIIATARAMEADTDKNGKAITGSKKRKIQAFVNSLHLTAAQKYMVMGYLGYSNINGEQQVKSYIGKLNLSKSEREALLKYSGYAV